jgi:hypothetical protein
VFNIAEQIILAGNLKLPEGVGYKTHFLTVQKTKTPGVVEAVAIPKTEDMKKQAAKTRAIKAARKAENDKKRIQKAALKEQKADLAAQRKELKERAKKEREEIRKKQKAIKADEEAMKAAIKRKEEKLRELK